MDEYTIHDILANYKEKLNRKLRILEQEFQPIIESGEKLSIPQSIRREKILSEVSCIKMYIDDLEYMIEKHEIK